MQDFGVFVSAMPMFVDYLQKAIQSSANLTTGLVCALYGAAYKWEGL